MDDDNIGTEVAYPSNCKFSVLLRQIPEDDIEESKARDMNTQTDLTLSDIDNFEVYKNWYVNENWKAFAQFAKFRKDILKEVKDEYFTKNKVIKATKKKQEPKKAKKKLKNTSISSIDNKRLKIGESSEWNFDIIDDTYSEAFLRNSLQKSWNIIIKTDRGGCKGKRLKNNPLSETFQEFSCQAYMQDNDRKQSISCGVSDGFQEMKVDYHDRNIQAITCETAATSTQTPSECAAGSDVWMQFPANNENSENSSIISCREFSVEWDLVGSSKLFKDAWI